MEKKVEIEQYALDKLDAALQSLGDSTHLEIRAGNIQLEADGLCSTLRSHRRITVSVLDTPVEYGIALSNNKYAIALTDVYDTPKPVDLMFPRDVLFAQRMHSVPVPGDALQELRQHVARLNYPLPHVVDDIFRRDIIAAHLLTVQAGGWWEGADGKTTLVPQASAFMKRLLAFANRAADARQTQGHMTVVDADLVDVDLEEWAEDRTDEECVLLRQLAADASNLDAEVLASLADERDGTLMLSLILQALEHQSALNTVVLSENMVFLNHFFRDEAETEEVDHARYPVPPVAVDNRDFVWVGRPWNEPLKMTSPDHPGEDLGLDVNTKYYVFIHPIPTRSGGID